MVFKLKAQDCQGFSVLVKLTAGDFVSFQYGFQALGRIKANILQKAQQSCEPVLPAFLLHILTHAVFSSIQISYYMKKIQEKF